MANDNQRLQGLQAGRAAAALAVAYYHSHVLFRGWPQDYVLPISGLKEHGYLGVNFFFAISGYVIASVCSKPGFSFREFAIKRFFRLYPVYWSVICLVILLKLLGVYIEASTYKAGYILNSMTLLPQGTTPFHQVTWSLEYEIAFYALAALVVPLLGVWGLAAVLFGLVRWALVSPPDFFTFHLVATLNSDFLAGVAAYLLRKPLSYVPASILVAAGLFGYYVAAIIQIPFSGSVAGFLLVSGLINAKWGWGSRPLRALVKIGDASYSLYLIHFLLLWIPAVVFARLQFQPPAWFAEPLRVAYLAAGVWLSLQMWEYIEEPMIDLGNKIAASKLPRATVSQPSGV